MDKLAYPQDNRSLLIDSPRNVAKWTQAMRAIYSEAALRGDWNIAFNNVTAKWDDMEKQEFKKWMLFYQEGAHNKYKTAQVRHIETGGSLIPNIDQLKASLPLRQPDMSIFQVQQDVNDAEEKAAQKAMVEKKIQALIGRLNSAEKLATDPRVQIALKRCFQMNFEEWVGQLQKLKREIQLAPMRASALVVAEDLIVKHANQLKQSGKNAAGRALLKIAQTPGSEMAGTPETFLPGGTPTTKSLNDAPAMNPGFLVGPGQPTAPSMPMNSTPSGGVEMPGQTETGEQAVLDFLKNLNGDEDNHHSDDEDSEGALDANDEDEHATISVTAQATPQLAPTRPMGDSGPSLEVSEDDLVPPQPKVPAPAVAPVHNVNPATSIDPFDHALRNVSVKDLIARLEAVAGILRNRELSRQLSIIDLIMDKLNLASFFPNLSEAMRSSLESATYAQSRIDDIIQKIKGSIPTTLSQEIEKEIQTGSDELEQIKQNLTKEEKEAKLRKEKRRMEDLSKDVAAEGVPAPAVPTKELAGPAQVQTAPAVRPVG